MTVRTAILIATGVLWLARPAQAEAVYDFVAQCRGEKLGHCFNRIGTRLTGLNTSPNRRICLPVSFNGMLANGVIPVSLLEHVRLKLSAARFGELRYRRGHCHRAHRQWDLPLRRRCQALRRAVQCASMAAARSGASTIRRAPNDRAVVALAVDVERRRAVDAA